MLCSECQKNPAILFFEKIENNQKKWEGLCYNCAKKRGIDPIETLRQQNEVLNNDSVNLDDVSKQFESIFKDLAENINLEDLGNISGAIAFGNPPDGINNEDDSEDGSHKASGTAIPLGAIFTNMFDGKNSSNHMQDDGQAPNGEKKRIKVDKKKNVKQNKKKKYLDTFGTNLTNKAKNNELDIIIGRDK